MQRVQDAPHHIKSAALLALYNDDDIKAKIDKYIDRLESREEATGQSPAWIMGTKRKAADEDLPRICVQCRQAFTDAENTSETCHFHDGKQVYRGQKADTYTGCAGDVEPDPDSEERLPYGYRNDFIERDPEEEPGDFIWSCCGARGDEEPCAKGRHEAVNGKRGRYGD
jgi:hypothetical protein